jgi:uracil phosphoribosyltransferase
MRVTVVDHPLIAHKLTTLRDERTDSPTFRRLTDELVTLLAYEATREVRVAPAEVRTPVGPAVGVRLTSPKPLVVPILRAGLGMLDGMVRILPTAEVGFLGLVRDDITAICLLSAPEGLALLERETASLTVPLSIVTAALDERLNERGYIVPGLGDAGDRLYGVV